MTRKEFFDQISSTAIPSNGAELSHKGILSLRIEGADSLLFDKSHEGMADLFLNSDQFRSFFDQSFPDVNKGAANGKNLEVVFHSVLGSETSTVVASLNCNELYDVVAEPGVPVRLYRLENAEGDGAYHMLMRVLEEDDNRQLSPDKDGDIPLVFYENAYDDSIYTDEKGWCAYHNYWYFGFKQIDGFLNWFSDPKDIEDFVDVGGMINEYEVDSKYILEGRDQVAFRFPEARKIASYAIREIQENCAGNNIQSRPKNKNRLSPA